MTGRGREIDIAKNLKLIEWLKAELIDAVGALFKGLLRSGADVVVDALATIIVVAYILGHRVGINFYTVDAKIKEKLTKGIDESHEVEQWYGDLSRLVDYLENKKR
ncbi:MazG-like family protein [Syntrophomonas erecta]